MICPVLTCLCNYRPKRNYLFLNQAESGTELILQQFIELTVYMCLIQILRICYPIMNFESEIVISFDGSGMFLETRFSGPGRICLLTRGGLICVMFNTDFLYRKSINIINLM